MRDVTSFLILGIVFMLLNGRNILNILRGLRLTPDKVPKSITLINKKDESYPAIVMMKSTMFQPSLRYEYL